MCVDAIAVQRLFQDDILVVGMRNQLLKSAMHLERIGSKHGRNV